MPWREPAYQGEFPSLGWDLLDWYSTYLRVPSGPFYGQPLELTDEQASIVVRWYALDPKDGSFRYRRGSVRRPQGWGKSPLLAAIALGELVGPVLFDGWNADGEPVGRRHATPWVQIAACSEDQTDNTYVQLLASLESSDAIADFGLDVGITRIYVKGTPGRLEPVTASSGSRLGQPITFCVMDETHLWTPQNGGKKLADTLRRNTAKMNARTFETTNAYRPGELSVAEDSHQAAVDKADGLLYDATDVGEVRSLKNRRDLRKALRTAYGDAKWVDVDRLIDEINDPATDPDDARRFYLNQIVTTSDQWVEPKLWQALQSRKALEAGDTITLGFDGGAVDDATALVACRVSDGFLKVLGLWEKPEGVKEWSVPRAEVDATVVRACQEYRVVRGYMDPPWWREELVRWSTEFDDSGIAAFETYRTPQMAKAVEALTGAIKNATVSHDGDRTFARHMFNARVKHTRHGDLIVKQTDRSPHKIDAAVAAVLAFQARLDALATDLKPVLAPAIVDPWSEPE
jgi:phage terminase large subunit-like protein